MSHCRLRASHQRLRAHPATPQAERLARHLTAAAAHSTVVYMSRHARLKSARPLARRTEMHGDARTEPTLCPDPGRSHHNHSSMPPIAQSGTSALRDRRDGRRSNAAATVAASPHIARTPPWAHALPERSGRSTPRARQMRTPSPSSNPGASGGGGAPNAGTTHQARAIEALYHIHKRRARARHPLGRAASQHGRRQSTEPGPRRGALESHGCGPPDDWRPRAPRRAGRENRRSAPERYKRGRDMTWQWISARATSP